MNTLPQGPGWRPVGSNRFRHNCREIVHLSDTQWAVGYEGTVFHLGLSSLEEAEDVARRMIDIVPFNGDGYQILKGTLETYIRWKTNSEPWIEVGRVGKEVTIDYSGSEPVIQKIWNEITGGGPLVFSSEKDWIQWIVDLWNRSDLTAIRHLLTMSFAASGTRGGVLTRIKFLPKLKKYQIDFRPVGGNMVKWSEPRIQHFSRSMRIPRSRIEECDGLWVRVNIIDVKHRVKNGKFPEAEIGPPAPLQYSDDDGLFESILG